MTNKLIEALIEEDFELFQEAVDELVEEIILNELSGETMGSYIRKSLQSSKDATSKLREIDNHPEMKKKQAKIYYYSDLYHTPRVPEGKKRAVRHLSPDEEKGKEKAYKARDKLATKLGRDKARKTLEKRRKGRLLATKRFYHDAGDDYIF